MTWTPSFFPRTLGIFGKRIEGDDCLMKLAQQRFREAGMGPEIYAVTVEQLDWALQFRPADDLPIVVHLARNLDLAREDSRHQIVEFARRFAGRVEGLVVHDHRKLAENFQDYLQAARELESRLETIESCPRLFIEYAAGLEIDTFVTFFESIHSLERISACVDIGHVGIHQVRKAYAQIHPGTDVCALKSQPERISQAMPDIENAVATVMPTILAMLEGLGTGGKPIHFHLHDGHPLSTFSPFGVSDHLSFLAEIPLSFDHGGRRRTGLIFGASGLAKVVMKALQVFGPQSVSFTLEIHESADRLPLGDAANLFSHWRDKANAERMNDWLTVLTENHRLLCDAVKAAMSHHHLPNEPRSEILKG